MMGIYICWGIFALIGLLIATTGDFDNDDSSISERISIAIVPITYPLLTWGLVNITNNEEIGVLAVFGVVFFASLLWFIQYGLFEIIRTKGQCLKENDQGYYYDDFMN